jgi:hypothetical protein
MDHLEVVQMCMLIINPHVACMYIAMSTSRFVRISNSFNYIRRGSVCLASLTFRITTRDPLLDTNQGFAHSILRGLTSHFSLYRNIWRFLTFKQRLPPPSPPATSHPLEWSSRAPTAGTKTLHANSELFLVQSDRWHVSSDFGRIKRIPTVREPIDPNRVLRSLCILFPFFSTKEAAGNNSAIPVWKAPSSILTILYVSKCITRNSNLVGFGSAIGDETLARHQILSPRFAGIPSGPLTDPNDSHSLEKNNIASTPR